MGVVLVAVGVVLVRGLRSPASWRDVAMAVGIAGLIAATPWSTSGASRTPTRSRTWCSWWASRPSSTRACWWRATGAWRGCGPRRRPAVLGGGVAVVAAYGLVLAALGMAPAAGVAALRETSIVMATVLAAVVLKERVERSRWLGSVVVVAGIALVVTS